MDQLYLPPREGEILQGDIFADVPSVFVRPGPLRVARGPFKQQPDREVWGVHTDQQPPRGGMRLTMDLGGEEILVHGYRDMAILLTHDCEIENDPRARTVAMIRPANQLSPEAEQALFSGSIEESYYSRFPLEAQMVEPAVERSFVDFMRLTTVDPLVLEECPRIASLSEQMRRALAERFRLFLFRRVA